LGGTLLVAHFVKALRYKPKTAGSIPDGVKGDFHRHDASGHTMALALTQPPIEKSKDKGKGKAIQLQT
jgi:hypothetical protein